MKKKRFFHTCSIVLLPFFGNYLEHIESQQVSEYKSHMNGHRVSFKSFANVQFLPLEIVTWHAPIASQKGTEGHY